MGARNLLMRIDIAGLAGGHLGDELSHGSKQLLP